jgi:tripartite-type tricarboxylate transporter receptor subunit TctC
MKTPGFVAFAVFVPAILASAAAGAQTQPSFPTRPMRIIVPFPTGGTIDIVGRITAQVLSDRLGYNVVVDNRAGAGGILGAELAVKAPPDGHTLCLCSAGAMITSPLLQAKPPYDARRDFTPVSLLAHVPYVLLARPGAYASLKDMIAAAKQKPGALNYGSAGTGSSSHLAAALFTQSASVNVTHVPYKGSAPAATELMGGQLHFVFEAIGQGTQYHRSGRLRALGVSMLKRSGVLPDVPTIAESGVPGYEMSTWHTLSGPRGLPAPIVTRLSSELSSAMVSPDVRERFVTLGTEPVGSTPEQLREQIAREYPRWEKLLVDLGLVKRP